MSPLLDLNKVIKLVKEYKKLNDWEKKEFLRLIAASHLTSK